ncbi:MAG: hypothetical protein NDI94_00555 [Candidatus Woesearchaeota archaeon]|nr:hypothetical protein [Candidatus Woesearchaeota archaeon]
MNKPKTDIPEPPKFNHDDIPEPPRLDSIKVPETHEKEVKIPEPPKLAEIPEPPAMPTEAIQEKKRSLFSLFKKDKKEFKNEHMLNSPPAMPELKEFPKIADVDKKADNKDGALPVPPQSNKLEEIPLPPKIDSEIKKDSAKETNKTEIKVESPKPLVLDSIPIPPSFNKDEKIAAPEHIEMPAAPIAPPVFEVPKDELIEPKPSEPAWLLEGESYIKNTPLTEVEGVGEKRAKILKKAGIKTAEHLAKQDHKSLSKKTKIPLLHAKKIVTYAKKITALKERVKSQKKTESISDVIKQLEEEKKAIVKLQNSDLDDDKLIELDGHKEVVEVLVKLEKKRNELTQMQTKLAEKESKLSGHEDSYKRDMDYIDNLKRRLDHDVRERTQYLINLEKEYFQKAQKLAAQQSEVSIKERDLIEREKVLIHKENDIKKKINLLEDKGITTETKEKKLAKIMEQLDKQDTLLKEKEEELVKREAEYLKKLDILENHEKNVLKQLEEKRKTLERKEKEIEAQEDRVYKKQRNVDKQGVAVEFAKNVVEEEKGKLIDDEFEQYLHDQLKGINGINYHDVSLVQNMKVGLEDSKKPVYQLVDQCRELLRANKVSEAKVYYNQLRDRYYGMSFSNQSEKQNVHNQIRQIYDEINLADIGRN